MSIVVADSGSPVEANLTQHAIVRLAQRGFHHDDVGLIQLIGTGVADGYIVLNRDCQAAERVIKQLMQRIRRLSGARLVITAGNVVTAYRAAKANERRLIRGAEERELMSPFVGSPY